MARVGKKAKTEMFKKMAWVSTTVYVTSVRQVPTPADMDDSELTTVTC